MGPGRLRVNTRDRLNKSQIARKATYKDRVLLGAGALRGEDRITVEGHLKNHVPEILVAVCFVNSYEMYAHHAILCIVELILTTPALLLIVA